MAVSLVARGLNQDIDTILKWRINKLFTFASIAAQLEGKVFK